VNWIYLSKRITLSCFYRRTVSSCTIPIMQSLHPTQSSSTSALLQSPPSATLSVRRRRRMNRCSVALSWTGRFYGCRYLCWGSSVYLSLYCSVMVDVQAKKQQIQKKQTDGLACGTRCDGNPVNSWLHVQLTYSLVQSVQQIGKICSLREEGPSTCHVTYERCRLHVECHWVWRKEYGTVAARPFGITHWHSG
jgi:hypothetical protein